jgi:general secretion pathway protein A
MYQSYFGLAEAPFSIAPAPRFLYMSQRHQEALAHLLYGVRGGGGFVLLTGEVGAGKTTICRCLLEQIPESCDVAYIFNPKLTVAELLSTICIEFGITYPADNTSIKVFIDCINAHLLEAHANGRQAVLIIDEAQNLAADVLEQMRLLTNLETNERKLLQIILIGQPELAAMLERPELKQLAQRIVARYHLGPMTRQEVGAYVRHRLEVAGTQRQLFPPALMNRLHRLSGGVPRIINVLCDRALLGTYVQGKDRVDRKTLAQAEREVLQTPTSLRRRTKRIYIAGMLGLLVGIAALAMLYQPQTATKSAPLTQGQSTSPPGTNKPLQEAPALSAAASTSPGEHAAYAALFKAWGASYRDGDPCPQAEKQGLRCRSGHGSLAELRLLNRPAVLTLHDSQGRTMHAILSKLDAQRATLILDEKTMPLSVNALEAQWPGDYTLFWRPPSDIKETLRPGDSGPGIAWLQAQLARIDGRSPARAKTALFDATLTERVKKFQHQHGLNPDGNVGPKTLILLVNESDATAPKLLTKLAAKPLRRSGGK